MAISQAELMTALQTLLSTVKFRLRGRRGTAAQLNPSLMKAGEFAFCTDTRTLYACYVDGTIEQVSHGFIPKATYGTLAALQAAHPTGTASDYYMVGTGPYHLYNWDGAAWADMGVWNDMSLYATAGSIGALSSLLTTVKTSIVAAINESFTNKMNKAGGSSNPFTAMPYVGTAPVVETGNNDNGAFIKFADGTMICRQFLPSPTGNSAQGSIFVSPELGWTYPVAFYDYPSVTYTPILVSGTTPASPIGATRASTYAESKSNTSCYVFYATSSATVVAKISFEAIGRWKA